MMTTAEKIQAIEESGWMLAWDGCHKIYILETREQADMAESYDYTIYAATEIRDLISSSCGLVFVNNWGLGGNETFHHEYGIEQCTEDIYEAAEGK